VPKQVQLDTEYIIKQLCMMLRILYDYCSSLWPKRTVYNEFLQRYIEIIGSGSKREVDVIHAEQISDDEINNCSVHVLHVANGLKMNYHK
jgi:hypothetical protein